MCERARHARRRVSPMPGEDPDAGAPSCSSSSRSSSSGSGAAEDGHQERLLPNGDLYRGQWRGAVPHGSGKYLWADGCMYEGEWRRGKATGRGRFSWPSGATYEGEFLDGFTHGAGTYVGPVHQKGVYYPLPAGGSPRTRDPREVFARELPECVRSGTGTEGQSSLTSLRSLKWLARSVSGRGSSSSSRSTGSGGSLVHFWGSDGEVKCDIGDDWRRRSLREGRGLPPPSPAPHLAKGTPQRVSRQQGLTIAKGHKNYELMLNLQLGIRHAVGRQGQPLLDLKSSAFDPKEKVWTKFPPEGSKYTPPHNSCDFKWKDYCPKVFRTLRKLFKVDPADYMLSLCGDDALRELSSPGKSGSFFYLTNDDRYMIKTMKKAEVKMLLKMLPAYYKHVRAFENTLVTKFFGLHCVKAGVHQKKVRFVIMGNLFCSDHTIHRRFDLKGSSLGRITDKPHAEIDEYTTLKDLDLNFIFRLQKQWFQEFQRQVDKDCEFLEQEKIMDYSLLVGVHFRGAIDIDGDKPATPRLSRWDRDHFLSDPNRWSTIKLGANMLSRAELTTRKNDNDVIGEPTREYCDVILYFGIIDILQDYDIGKKLEHAYKSFQYDSTSISAVDPRQYSRRFRDFIYKAFQEDKSDS
ncbi:hypothetical protein QOZ80_3BG0279480 [Eleusine coracana subsp. coracana]|nr:hypothetical protein QOZ80_3BG0279480 [Eleusine coracana subsp. coracana]